MARRHAVHVYLAVHLDALGVNQCSFPTETPEPLSCVQSVVICLSVAIGALVLEHHRRVRNSLGRSEKRPRNVSLGSLLPSTARKNRGNSLAHCWTILLTTNSRIVSSLSAENCGRTDRADSAIQRRLRNPWAPVRRCQPVDLLGAGADWRLFPAARTVAQMAGTARWPGMHSGESNRSGPGTRAAPEDRGCMGMPPEASGFQRRDKN